MIAVNNKGQSLIVFVLLLPLLALLIGIVADLGNLEITKKNYEDNIKSTIKYGLKHLDDENINQKLNNLLDTNINANTSLTIQNESIKISVKDKQKSLFNDVLKKTYDIDITYIGYKDGEK